MITPQQWKQIQKDWFYKRFFRFRCDGYALTLEFSIMKGGKIGYYIYVNGVLKGEWLSQDCEERRRFCCRKSKLLHSPKERRMWQKVAKLQGKKYRPEPFIWHEPWWRSFSAFKKHLLANNKNIEYLEDHDDKTTTEEMAQAA